MPILMQTATVCLTGTKGDSGSDPAVSDTTGDGMPDGFEWSNGFDPVTPGDQLLDADNDGLDNLGEYLADTDPWTLTQTGEVCRWHRGSGERLKSP